MTFPTVVSVLIGIVTTILCCCSVSINARLSNLALSTDLYPWNTSSLPSVFLSNKCELVKSYLTLLSYDSLGGKSISTSVTCGDTKGQLDFQLLMTFHIHLFLLRCPDKCLPRLNVSSKSYTKSTSCFLIGSYVFCIEKYAPLGFL